VVTKLDKSPEGGPGGVGVGEGTNSSLFFFFFARAHASGEVAGRAMTKARKKKTTTLEFIIGYEQDFSSDTMNRTS
jgi:hypothetical protein